MSQELWEILVPTEKPDWVPGKKRFFSTKHHRRWDEQVIAVANGLTVLHPTKGAWIAPGGKLFRERMLPVRILCTAGEIESIIEFTAKHYSQLAVMAYKISGEVIIREFAKEP